MIRGRIRLLATVALTTFACGGGTEELGSSPLDAAARFPAVLAQDPCLVVMTDAVARWSGSEVRRLEARLPTVDGGGQARAGCVAFAREGGSDDPFFEVDMKRPADPATDPPDAPREGVAFAVVEGTAFELRCERCGDRTADALESIVTSYAALVE